MTLSTCSIKNLVDLKSVVLPYAVGIVSIFIKSVFNALSIGGGLAAAALLYMKGEDREAGSQVNCQFTESVRHNYY